MAGTLILKEQAIVTLTSTGTSLATGSGGSAATVLDARAAGNAADLFEATMSLTCQFATVTGIAAGTIIADLYLLPAIDGTNYPDIDLTAGASYIPFSYRVGSFIASKIPTAATNALFNSNDFDLKPRLYTAYIVNRSGQTMTANWSLKVLANAAQYT